MRSLIALTGLIVVLTGCAGGDPATPSGFHPLPGSGTDDPDRAGTAEVTGSVTLNGATNTSPTFDDAPFEARINGRTDDLCLVTLTPVAIPSASNNPLVQFRGTTASYGSLPYPTNNTAQFMPIYLTATEPVGVILHNSATVGGALHSQAVKFSGTIKTTPKNDSGEPNDDGNPATITDRIIGASLPVGATLNRSFFQRTVGSNEDREDWYKLTFATGERYRIDLTNSTGKWGNWRYDLILVNGAGTIVASALNVTGTSTTIEHVAATPGSFFLQIVGSPLSRRGGSVYFSEYSVSARKIAIPVITAVTPSGGTVGAELSLVQFAAVASNEPTSWSWTFTNTLPTTSTDVAPIVRLLADGSFAATVTATNAAGTSAPFTFGYQVAERVPPAFKTMRAADPGALGRALVHQGRVMLAYYESGAQDLRFSIATPGPPNADTDWTTHLVNGSGSVGAELDMAVVNGVPVIAYLNQGSLDLKVARATQAVPTASGHWIPHTVVSATDAGLSPSIVDNNGRIAVIFHQTTDTSLQMAGATIASPTSSSHYLVHGVSNSDVTGAACSATMLNGRIAIAFTERDTKGLTVDIRFARALEQTPSNGTHWNRHILDIADVGVGSIPSVTVLNGLPVVGFTRESLDLYHVYASSSATPTSDADWNPIGGYVDSTGLPLATGRSLATVNGRLAVAIGESNGGLLVGRPDRLAPIDTVDWDFVLAQSDSDRGIQASVIDFNGLLLLTDIHSGSGEVRVTRALSDW